MGSRYIVAIVRSEVLTTLESNDYSMLEFVA
jgi:hypothetical protein